METPTILIIIILFLLLVPFIERHYQVKEFRKNLKANDTVKFFIGEHKHYGRVISRTGNSVKIEYTDVPKRLETSTTVSETYPSWS